MKKVLLNKIVPFLAISFPGGYKFFVVFLLAFVETGGNLEKFSEGFFWAALACTFSGIPLSAVISSRHTSLSTTRLLTWALSTSMLVVILFSIFFLYLEVKVNIIDVIFSSVFLSVYEVLRRRVFNREEYSTVFLCGVSTFGMLLVYLLTYEYWFNYPLSIVFAFMAIPLLFFVHSEGEIITKEASSKYLFKSYFSFVSSNFLSTSLNTIVPIVLIQFIGSEISPKMAKIYSISTLLLLLPRVISAKKIPQLRRNGSSISAVYNFYSLIKIYMILVFLSSLIAIYYSYSDDWYIYWLLLVGIQLSQLNLPFSNVFSVESRSDLLLKVNLIGCTFFFALSYFSYLIFSENFELVFLIVFCLHQLVKLYFSKAMVKSIFLKV